MQHSSKKSATASPSSELSAYHELQVYAWTHGGTTFIPQHVVDAWTAQQADDHTKPIALAFSLVGLYLHVERGYSGLLVQKAHMALARRKQPWPSFSLPQQRGSVTASQVLASPVGPDRDQAIDAWCASVWNAYHESRAAVAELVERHGIGGWHGSRFA